MQLQLKDTPISGGEVGTGLCSVIKMKDLPELTYQRLEIFSRNANSVMSGEARTLVVA